MKIVCISDTHNRHDEINWMLPQGDVLVHTGDFMTSGYSVKEVVHFLNWMNDLPYEHKILVAGNHDRLFEIMPEFIQNLLKTYPSITYLEDSGVTIGGVNFWGTPHQPPFYNWAFNRTEEKLADLFALVPDNTNVLLSHSPAYCIGDRLENTLENVGSKSLLNRIGQLKNLKLHVFGHIHYDYGDYKIGLPENQYTAFNASIVNEQYIVQNKPLVYELM